MLEPLSNKKCVLQHKFKCPVCGTEGQHALLIFDGDDLKKYGISMLQCLDCFNAYGTVYDKNSNPIDYIIEGDENDRSYLD